jgi:hypothetical protein
VTPTPRITIETPAKKPAEEPPEQPASKPIKSTRLTSSGVEDPFVIMLSSPVSLRDPAVVERTVKAVAQLRGESRKPRIAFAESDELTDTDVETLREIARKSGVEEMAVHGRRR